MAEVKGKFIVLACSLMTAYPEAQAKADELLKKKTGRGWVALEPEGWYDTKLFNDVMEMYSKSSLSGTGALVTLGKRVYPTIKRTAGIPTNINSALEMIQFEAEGFLQNHRGSDVVPRKFISARDKEVVVQATAPGYSEKLYEGVYLGILDMSGIKTGKVTNSGDSTFIITW